MIVYPNHKYFSGIDDSKQTENMWVLINVKFDYLKQLLRKTCEHF